MHPTLASHILQTGTKHYVGPFEYLGKIQPREPPFTEDLPRLNALNFYYTLEDILFKETSNKETLTWSEQRPDDEHHRNPLRLRGICKHEGMALKFPGTRAAWNGYYNASDANLIAEHHVWAKVAPHTKNDAFNIVNVDVFK
ncbi:hypothetical protein RJ639_022784 [Escallonia herrerae]|uniref:Uncharacterized protein n=1 Tax=Escallonia herrerae TaxID=1293975 RepID=A0AA89ADV5_9ASTE|nr:hypothetical protein RJ639_022784 [Escallonia herrerae]